MKLFTILIITFFCISCQNSSSETSPVISTKEKELTPQFEAALNQLNAKEINSLDEATSLFGEFVNNAIDPLEKDKLFMPYFNFYNHGRKLLLNQEQAIIEKYGFRKVKTAEKTYLVPMESNYLKENIIHHLSDPMQQFCIQQLKEFEEPKDLTAQAKLTLWWENFNAQNPDFLLKEMTAYHYKNWHLKNLLSGTKNIPVFDQNRNLLKEASIVYNNLMQQNPNSNTAEVVSTYLNKLKENNMRKTKEILTFLKEFE